MQLIIAGFGNPEAKYAHNRHNLGFLVLGAIAGRWSLGRSGGGSTASPPRARSRRPGGR
jgi:peptidyl-tRNA hydrolase